MRWSSVVRQCRFDCVRVDLFGLSNMLFMLLFPVLSCVAALVLTVTGAPGQVAVSVYGGVCGYFDFAGNMDMAIAIRTAVLKEGTAYVQAGAGLVMDSNPDSETLETVNKSAAPLRAVLTASGLAPLDADAAVNAAQ